MVATAEGDLGPWCQFLPINNLYIYKYKYMYIYLWCASFRETVGLIRPWSRIVISDDPVISDTLLSLIIKIALCC